jgi:penicillin-binding protein 2
MIIFPYRPSDVTETPNGLDPYFAIVQARHSIHFAKLYNERNKPQSLQRIELVRQYSTFSSSAKRMAFIKQRVKERDNRFRTVGEGARTWVFLGLFTVLFLGVMSSRLAYLQIVEGSRNQEMADENRIRLIPRPPERGKIFDRKGRLLATNIITESLFLWPIARNKPEWPRTIDLVSQILKIPKEKLLRQINQAGANSLSRIRIAKGLTPAQVIALEERQSEMVGIEIDREFIRAYPNGEIAAHVLGYIGEINAEELAAKEKLGYRMGDVIGQAGVESTMESTLRGTWGGQQVEVDGTGKILRILGEKVSSPGRDLYLTLDLEVQRAAEKALGNRNGAVVAMDPRNGDVIAMVSHPAYDPNWFTRYMSDAQWQDLQQRSFPFVNRATQGFPPASTFKVVTLVAGLESSKFTPDSILYSRPLYFGGHTFYDWNRSGFGNIGFVTAMAWSSNTFFGQVAMGVGPDQLVTWTRRFGFGQRTGIELPSEAAGLVPDQKWKQKTFNEGWYAGDSVIMAIGQGALQASPLQVAVMFAVPASGGYRVRPHLRRDDRRNPNQWRQSLGLRPTTLSTLRQGLRQVVTGGTGSALNVAGLPSMAGKSGTGEDPPRPHHTWFGAYAPSDKPEIVVVAFVENSGGGGSSVAGPIVLPVMSTYFGKKLPEAPQ